MHLRWWQWGGRDRCFSKVYEGKHSTLELAQLALGVCDDLSLKMGWVGCRADDLGLSSALIILTQTFPFPLLSCPGPDESS